ncbi:kappa-type opioid receptor-like [Pieris rapae]|uniref:kappa-type opioid receptor-like n=1 Tax=Pieris rapae TaxID=64459 RepID=UPI001E27C875|nr:kappa-type opioid receptor-like [Pieris rapae]
MYGVNRNNITDPNTNNYTFSPVTFNDEWPKVWRLVIMVTMATLGTTLNGFFVASFFVERPLRRAGLVYLACIGLTDMLITAVILPVASVVLLSGDWDNVRVCNVIQCLGMSAVYCYSLFFMFTAIEEYLRVCCSKKVYRMVNRCNVAITTIAAFVLSFSLGSVGVYLNLDYDYCERLHYGNIYYRAISVVMLHLVPCFFTIYCLCAAYLSVRRRAASQPSYRRSFEYGQDKSIAALNLTTYATFFFAWIPYLIISFNLGSASNDQYYNSIWFGHGRAVLATSLYSILDRSFRRAFSHLFNYCCCKNNLSGPLAPRHRREYCTRVRLLQPNMFIARSAQIRLAGRARAASLIRETQHL